MICSIKMRRGEAPLEDLGINKKKPSKPPKTLSLHHLPLMWKSTNKQPNSSKACAPTSVKMRRKKKIQPNVADRKQTVLPSEERAEGHEGEDGR